MSRSEIIPFFLLHSMCFQFYLHPKLKMQCLLRDKIYRIAILNFGKMWNTFLEAIFFIFYQIYAVYVWQLFIADSSRSLVEGEQGLVGMNIKLTIIF